MHCNPAGFPPHTEFGKNALEDEFDRVQDCEPIESLLISGCQVRPARLQSIRAWAGVEDDGHCSSIRPPEEALNCPVCCGMVGTVEAFR